MTEKQQRELEALVKEVLKKRDRIIPIIGDDCFVGYISDGEQEKLVPLQLWITDKLLENNVEPTIKNKIYSEGYRGFDILFEQCKHLYEDDDDDFQIMDFKEKIILAVEGGLKENKIFLRNDVKKFLSAGKFEVVATTCPFHILEKEVACGNKKYNVSWFAPFSLTTDSKSEETLKLPSVYQLFGNADGGFVTGEDELLRYLHYLNQTETEKGYGASPLVKYIKDKEEDKKGMGLLMPIGCNNLPNWLFRFLWYPFSQIRLSGNGNTKGGIWHKHSNDESFYKFLRKHNFKTFSTDVSKDDKIEGDPVLLILTQEFNKEQEDIKKYATNNLSVKWNGNCEWDFFISYASEDRNIAKSIFDVLTNQCGKNVWMDNRINVGDNYWKTIEYGIEHSHKFIFIITQSYLNKAIDRNHYNREIGEVQETGVYKEIGMIKYFFQTSKKERENGYSFPIIMDGTKVTYTDYNGTRHENETLINGVLENLHKFPEYDKLQTETLFKNIQDIICSEETLEKNIIKIFNN